MFTQAIETMINSVQDAKKNFVTTYYPEAAQKPALAFVEAQREFATEVARSTEDFTTRMQRATRDAAKV